MGEINPDLVAGKAELVEKPMPFLNTDTPALVVGRFKSGNAVFVNLAPGPEDTFTLILAPITMLDEGKENMPNTIRGWFKPAMSVSDFLAAYSTVGGTHHAAMVYGNVTDDLARFGELMGWDVVVLE
jgi:L-arabinose isomerase